MGGFATITSKIEFVKKFPHITVLNCIDLSPTVKLDEEAFDCFLTYMNHSLDLEEKFIYAGNGKGNYFFFFSLLTLIASCAEGIYASEEADAGSFLTVVIEPMIIDDRILINHEVNLECTKDLPKCPVEFTTFSKKRSICRSVLEVKTKEMYGNYEETKYQLFAQLVVAMEKNMENTPAVEDAIFGAFASTDHVLFAVIELDASEKFHIRHTKLLTFCQYGGKSDTIRVFNAETSKLAMEYYFSMVMNDGKHRKINHAEIQTSIDAFRSKGTANELIRKESIRKRREIEQQCRDLQEREIGHKQREKELERKRRDLQERNEELERKLLDLEEREELLERQSKRARKNFSDSPREREDEPAQH